jgi:prolyl oligopeptidase PreP (S9A serine peptidase family)
MHWFNRLDLGSSASRLLLMSSNGGSDLVEMREFDLESRQFVDNGFRAGPGRFAAAWLDINALLSMAGSLWSRGSSIVARSLALPQVRGGGERGSA